MNHHSTAELIAQIQSTLSQALQVPVEAISPELAFGDILQWDSMGHMEVMMSLEAAFGIEINEDTIRDLTSVPAIRTHLQENGYA